MPTTQTKRERAEEEKRTTSEHVETPGLEPVGQRHLEDTVHKPQEAGEAADDPEQPSMHEDAGNVYNHEDARNVYPRGHPQH